MDKQKLMAAVEELFSDTSRPAYETREDLEEVATQIETMIDSLPERGDDEEEA